MERISLELRDEEVPEVRKSNEEFREWFPDAANGPREEVEDEEDDEGPWIEEWVTGSVCVAGWWGWEVEEVDEWLSRGTRIIDPGRWVCTFSEVELEFMAVGIWTGMPEIN